MRNPHLLIDENHWGPIDVWSIYVDRTCYRITFRVKGRCAILRRVGKHDIYGDF